MKKITSYDLIIKGIRPERLDDAEQIKNKASQSFKIEVDQLEDLWSAPSGLCIRRNVSKEEASQIQATLAKAGLICLNRPAASDSDLSLTVKEKKIILKKRDFICPYCEKKIILDSDKPDPLECPVCSGIIAKYAETQERKEIRNRLMNMKTAREQQEIQLNQAEAERIRKQKIEDEIAREIFGKQKTKVSKPLIIAGAVAVLIASVATYFLTNNKDSGSGFVATTTTTPNIPSASSAEKTTSAAVSSGDHSPEAIALSGEAPPPTFASGGPSDAQSALQDTHDKANKVLGAFGLDADKMGKNAGGASATSEPAKLVSIPPASVAVDTQTASNTVPGASDTDADKFGKNTDGAASSETTKLVSIPPGNAVPNDIKKTLQPDSNTIPVTVALLHDGENNQEWDLFLNQHITYLTESKKLVDAYKLAQQLVDTESYMHTMGLLLSHAQQENQDKLVNDVMAAMEGRINSLPASNQAEYLAQAGFYQLRITKKNDLLTRAEAAWKQVKNPDDQLKAALKIAVYNFKAGNIETANNYFRQIDHLLAKNKSPDEQVSARSAIGQAYYDVNDSANAIKWLASAEMFIPEVSIATLKELIGSHAYTHQWKTTTLQNIAKEKQGQLIYHAVQVSLKNNVLDQALSISKDLQEPTYKALAADLVASYTPNIASSSLDSAEKQLQTIKLPTDKAIIASNLSRHYTRMGNTLKAAELMIESEKQLKSLPSSSGKDSVLVPIIKNFARALQFNIADNLTFFIHTETTKSMIKNEINQIKGIAVLL